MQQRNLLRRVLRRVLETAFEKVLRRVLRRCLAVGLMGRTVLRMEKGLARRHFEGGYDPVGVRPNIWNGVWKGMRRSRNQ